MTNFSKRTTLASATGRTGATVAVVHHSAGIEPAGSGTRYTDECYSYHWTLRDGTTGGQQYKTREAAIDRFNSVLPTGAPKFAVIIAATAAAQQDMNDHTGVQLTIARAFGDPLHVQLFERIIEQQERLGYLTPQLQNDRETIARDLTKHIRDTNPQALEILANAALLFSIGN